MSRTVERMARARAEFEAAMALGCSIPELRRRREADRHYLRQRARGDVDDHTNELMSGPSEGSQGDFRRFDAPWMMRD